MTTEPALITAFIAGIALPVGLFSIWIMVKAVRRGMKVNFGGDS